MIDSYFASKSGWGIGPLKDSALVMMFLWALLPGLTGGPGGGALPAEGMFLCGFFFDKVLGGGLDVFTGYGPITCKCAHISV